MIIEILENTIMINTMEVTILVQTSCCFVCVLIVDCI